MDTGLSRRRAGFPYFLPAALLFACLARVTCAAEPGTLPLRPGEAYPQPRQRNLSEILDMPQHDTACPVCNFVVIVPDRDKLMRRPAGTEGPLVWNMDNADRDADLCPHPAAGKLAYQADIVVCPSCGFSAPEELYAGPVAPLARAWVVSTFRSQFRAAQKQLLGARAETLTDNEIIAFFNRQAEIPDTIRLEYNRIRSLARKDPALVRAEAVWLAAWAARREITGRPKGEFLARRWDAVKTLLAETKRTSTGLEGDIEALRFLLGQVRGRDRLGPGDQLAARTMLTALQFRLGYSADAERELENLVASCRERFRQPEQDPLWQAVSPRGTREKRRRELEELRTECAAELQVRLELAVRETDYLREAAGLIREGILGGELTGKPDEARFYAYLAGEFHRRSGSLPQASEWFKLVLAVTPAESPLEIAAGVQLGRTQEQAGGNISLLSAIGEDADVFEIIRDICRVAVFRQPEAGLSGMHTAFRRSRRSAQQFTNHL